MSALHFTFLGSPEVKRAGQLIVLPTRKTLALLVYLAIEERLQSREKLISLFWPDSDEIRGRGSLRRSLVQLRQALNGSTVQLITERDTVRLQMDESGSADFQLLEAAFKLTRNFEESAMAVPKAQAIRILQQAVATYRGDFLEGFFLEDAVSFDDWASVQREAFHRRLSLVLERLAQWQLESTDWTEVIETATRWIQHDPFNESAYYALMQAHLNNGDRAAAWRSYESCRVQLNQEFNAAPSAALEALAERIRQAISTQPVPKPAPVVASPSFNPHHRRVLIVDDEPDILDMLNNQLQRFGYEVTVLHSPKEVLPALLANQFDLLITDAMMPGISGYELVRAVRTTEGGNNLPILMLTSLSSSEDALQAFRDGVDEFLSKPWKLEVLRSKIQYLLERDHASQTSVLPSRWQAQALSSGLPALDHALGGSWPAGSNILILGEWGSGKSTFVRHFLSTGLLHGEPAMFVNLDDTPEQVFHHLNMLTGDRLDDYVQQNKFRLVDATEWLVNSIHEPKTEQAAISGLASAIIRAGTALGQNTEQQAGGRRVLDSINSLFLHFELGLVQRFLLQLARTAKSYGGVSSIFLLEQKVIDERAFNHIKYFMDGILEMRVAPQLPERFEMRVVNLKWQNSGKAWFEVNYI